MIGGSYGIALPDRRKKRRLRRRKVPLQVQSLGDSSDGLRSLEEAAVVGSGGHSPTSSEASFADVSAYSRAESPASLPRTAPLEYSDPLDKLLLSTPPRTTADDVRYLRALEGVPFDDRDGSPGGSAELALRAQAEAQQRSSAEQPRELSAAASDLPPLNEQLSDAIPGGLARAAFLKNYYKNFAEYNKPPTASRLFKRHAFLQLNDPNRPSPFSLHLPSHLVKIQKKWRFEREDDYDNTWETPVPPWICKGTNEKMAEQERENSERQLMLVE